MLKLCAISKLVVKLVLISVTYKIIEIINATRLEIKQSINTPFMRNLPVALSSLNDIVYNQ